MGIYCHGERYCKCSNSMRGTHQSINTMHHNMNGFMRTICYNQSLALPTVVCDSVGEEFEYPVTRCASLSLVKWLLCMDLHKSLAHNWLGPSIGSLSIDSGI